MIIKNKGLSILIVICLSLVLITFSQNSDHERHYVIAVNLDLSGDLADSSASVLEGIEFAIDQFNKSGGYDGTVLELEVYDNKSNPSEGERIVSVAKEKGSIAMISYADEETMTVIASKSNQKEMINIALWGDLQQESRTDNYNFKIQISSLFRNYLAANFAYMKFKKAENIIVISSEGDETQNSQAKEFINRVLYLQNIKVTHLLYNDLMLEDSSEIIEKMQRGDLVYLIGDQQQSADIFKSLVAKNNKISILVQDKNEILSQDDSFAKSQYYYMTTYNENNISKDILENFEEDHTGSFNDKIAIGFDAISFLVNSIMSENTTETSALSKALSKSYNVSLITGELSIDAYNNAFKSIWVNSFLNKDVTKYILVEAYVVEKVKDE